MPDDEPALRAADVVGAFHRTITPRLVTLPAAEPARPVAPQRLRLHYAKTLRAWHEAFNARRAEAEAMFDARFCRMWEFYLSLSEAAFRHEDIVIFQIQLARRQESVPLTRDYLPRAEAALRNAEARPGVRRRA
ncbi:MAG: hypothetical protein EBR82_01435 [Caulobacteraceae bacterium]|nr:hypothetical protein [Caulobacteraceae bacterium]